MEPNFTSFLKYLIERSGKSQNQIAAEVDEVSSNFSFQVRGLRLPPHPKKKQDYYYLAQKALGCSRSEIEKLKDLALETRKSHSADKRYPIRKLLSAIGDFTLITRLDQRISFENEFLPSVDSDYRNRFVTAFVHALLSLPIDEAKFTENNRKLFKALQKSMFASRKKTLLWETPKLNIPFKRIKMDEIMAVPGNSDLINQILFDQFGAKLNCKFEVATTLFKWSAGGLALEAVLYKKYQQNIFKEKRDSVESKLSDLASKQKELESTTQKLNEAKREMAKLEEEITGVRKTLFEEALKGKTYDISEEGVPAQDKSLLEIFLKCLKEKDLIEPLYSALTSMKDTMKGEVKF